MDDIVKRIRQQSYFGLEPYEAADEIEQLRQCVAELEEMYELSADVTSTTLARNAELTAERDRLSELCDKWNFECDEMREDNERLANVVNAMKKAYESAEDSVLALKKTRNRLAEERDKATQYWQIAEGRCDALMKQRDELLAAIALAMPVMDAHAGPSRLADFHAALASVKEKQNAD